MISYKHLSDEKLLELISSHNESAIAALLDRYKNKFYTSAYLLVKDRYIAEDIFQEACVKIFRCVREGKYKDDGKFLAWAIRVTRNLAIDHLRISKRMPKVTLPDGKDIFSVLNFGEETREDHIMRQQSSARVRKMLDHISDEQREVIVMRLFGNMSFKEIAEHTQVSLNTALGRMRYGLINLRKLMDEKRILL